MRGFTSLSLSALENNLIVFSTNRKIREFKKDSSDFILPKTLSLGEFLQKAIIVKNLSKCGEISQILYMQQACEKTKKITQALNFLQASVVNELMEHFQVNNKADLASKLNAL